MKWSWTLGKFAGINVRIHWTFLLLLAWVGISYAASGGWLAALNGIVFISAVFVCVVLHEFGHALVAARFGVPTEDITLLPIGGISRMQRIPEEPKQELWIAVAGPAVNIVIAAVIFLGLTISAGLGAVTTQPSFATSIFVNLMWVNIALVAFNVLPAFPMDGGRVLRALLAMKMDYVRATRVAANTGQMMAILFGLAGLFFNPLLLFIALFVYIGAEAEAQMVELRSLLHDLSVRDAMMTQFRKLSANNTLEEAADELLAGPQQDFPVFDDNEFQGILSRQELVKGLREEGKEATVGKWLTKAAEPLKPTEPLVQALEAMRNSGVNAVPVFENGDLVGILSVENISELIMVRSATEGGSTIARNHPIAATAIEPDRADDATRFAATSRG